MLNGFKTASERESGQLYVHNTYKMCFIYVFIDFFVFVISHSYAEGRGLDNAKGGLQGSGTYGQGGSYSGGYQSLKPSVKASPSRALSKSIQINQI